MYEGDEPLAQERAERKRHEADTFCLPGQCSPGRCQRITGRTWPGCPDTRDPADPRTGEECEHGLDAGLCMGPSHYPTTAQEAAGVLYPGQL